MKVLIKLSLSLLFVLQASLLKSQVYCTQENQELCQTKLKSFSDLQSENLAIDVLAVKVAKSFLGTPYVAKTLELGDKEQLVIDLQGLDCTTFLENVVVFSRLIKKGSLDIEDFQKELENLRYRSGKLAEYPSRLHYFTEWIQDNEKKGILRDITQEIGGNPYPKVINFMSTHREAYKQLGSDQYHMQIKAAEANLNTHKRFYLPKADIPSFESSIKSGDLLAITTSIKGLDVSHVGLAYKKNNRVHLLHASTRSKAVEITDIPLADYLKKSKSQSGIMVCRLEDPS